MLFQLCRDLGAWVKLGVGEVGAWARSSLQFTAETTEGGGGLGAWLGACTLNFLYKSHGYPTISRGNLVALISQIGSFIR